MPPKREISVESKAFSADKGAVASTHKSVSLHSRCTLKFRRVAFSCLQVFVLGSHVYDVKISVAAVMSHTHGGKTGGKKKKKRMLIVC